MLYWADDGSIFGDDEEVADAVDGSTYSSARVALLESVDRFLSVTDIVRQSVRDPADVLAAQHTLHLPFGPLCEKPRHQWNNGDYEPPFPKHSNAGPLDVPRPALLMDVLA